MRKFVASVALATVFVAGSFLGSVPAKANIIDFSFSGVSGTEVLSGVVTTGAGDVATLLSGNVVDGLFSGPITSLIPVGTSGYSAWQWDNVITGTPPFFSTTNSSGLLFLFGPGNTVGNLYSDLSGNTYFSLSEPANLYNPGDAGILTIANASAAAAPLPAALPLFATGLGAMGLLGWRRKRKNAAAIAA
jgi:hypothetical protein